MRKSAIVSFFALAVFTIAGAYLVAQAPQPPQQDPPGQPNQPQPPQQNPSGQQPQQPYQPQPPAQGQTTNPAPAHGGMTARHVKQLLGTNVTIQGGSGIGTIDDVVFNDNGCIDYVIVVQEGRYVIVPWPAAQFNWNQRAATLVITQDRFREVPVYNTQTIRQINYYEPAWQSKIYGYYNVQPTHREQRIENRQERRGNK